MLVEMSKLFPGETEGRNFATGKGGLNLPKEEVQSIMWDNRFSTQNAAYKILSHWMMRQTDKVAAHKAMKQAIVNTGMHNLGNAIA